ncbi:MAG: hypothetical protein CM1200mP20_01800 [Pseudomonadota bacterium]|nr:MAG: hypothetical protein CM1200mP20_01800 [Pseudomonadota bacterium]
MLGDTDQHWSVVKVLRTGGGSRPRVEQVRLGDQLAVLKDHSGCDPLFAMILGRTLARASVKRSPDWFSGWGAGTDRASWITGTLMEWMPAVPFKYVERDLQFWGDSFQSWGNVSPACMSVVWLTVTCGV